MQIFVCR